MEISELGRCATSLGEPMESPRMDSHGGPAKININLFYKDTVRKLKFAFSQQTTHLNYPLSTFSNMFHYVDRRC